MTAKHRARLGSPLRLHGSFELFGKSRKLVQKNIWVFGPLYALPLLFSFHSWVWTPALGSQNGHWWTTDSWFGSGLSASSVPSYMWYGFVGFSFFWLFFVLTVGTIVQIMSQEAQLEATEGKALDFIKLWAVVKELGWRMFGLYLVIGLYVFLGLIFFIIPGLIMLRRYFLAPYQNLFWLYLGNNRRYVFNRTFQYNSRHWLDDSFYFWHALLRSPSSSLPGIKKGTYL
jgi:hypothetical protein